LKSSSSIHRHRHRLEHHDPNSSISYISYTSPLGYIDLSKRRVDPEDAIKCEERYNKAKAVHSVLRHVAEVKDLKLEDLCRTVSWPLYKKYGHAYDAFKLALSTDSDNPVDIFADLEVDEMIKELILTYVKRRLAPQPG